MAGSPSAISANAAAAGGAARFPARVSRPLRSGRAPASSRRRRRATAASSRAITAPGAAVRGSPRAASQSGVTSSSAASATSSATRSVTAERSTNMRKRFSRSSTPSRGVASSHRSADGHTRRSARTRPRASSQPARGAFVGAPGTIVLTELRVQERGRVGAAYLDAGGFGEQAERGHRVASGAEPLRSPRNGVLNRVGVVRSLGVSGKLCAWMMSADRSGWRRNRRRPFLLGPRSFRQRSQPPPPRLPGRRSARLAARKGWSQRATATGSAPAAASTFERVDRRHARNLGRTSHHARRLAAVVAVLDLSVADHDVAVDRAPRHRSHAVARRGGARCLAHRARERPGRVRAMCRPCTAAPGSRFR